MNVAFVVRCSPMAGLCRGAEQDSMSEEYRMSEFELSVELNPGVHRSLTPGTPHDQNDRTRSLTPSAPESNSGDRVEGDDHCSFDLAGIVECNSKMSLSDLIGFVNKDADQDPSGLPAPNHHGTVAPESFEHVEDQHPVRTRG